MQSPATRAAGSVFFSRHPGFARVDVVGGSVTVRTVCGPDNGRGLDPCVPGSTTYGPVTVSGPPPANQPPVASSTVTCSSLSCSFSGTGSTDPDGTVVRYDWSFGDGSTGTGATVSHTYADAGSYQVTLTVTDDRGATGSTTRTVSVQQPTGSTINFVGVRSSNTTTKTATVPVPAGVAAGDGLLLMETVASTTITAAAPTGAGSWTLLGTREAGTMVTRVYARTAQAGDAGKIVSVSLGGYAKVALQVAAYRGTSASSPVGTVAMGADTTSTASHTTPVVTVPDGRSWVVSFWADKSTSTTAWTVPGGVVARDVLVGTGSGYLCAVLANSNAAVSAGSYGGLTATTDQPATKAVTATVVLNAG